MKRIDLGGDHINLATLIDTRLLIQANSGGGKSWCIRRLLELSHGQVQHLVIDPEGEFNTLREHYDYVLAAKAGGDTSADPRAAKLLARRLLELGASAVLDIYELKAHERVRFVRHFLEALVDAPRKLWHPVLVIVDEAHVYCPQKGEAESAGAVIDLATRGRKRGFCAVLATQRLSKLHKDAAAECNNKLIGRTGLDVDMKRAGDELGLSTADARTLRDLKPGHFWAFGPAFDHSGVKAIRIGPVATTHPKAGARLAFTAPPPTEKIRKMLPKLADLPAEAEEEKRTIASLTRDLAEARRQLKEGQPPEIKPVEVPVLDKAFLEVLQEARREIHDAFQVPMSIIERAMQDVNILGDRLKKIGDTRPTRATVCPPPRGPRIVVDPKMPRGTVDVVSGGSRVRVTDIDRIPRAQQRILDQLRFLMTVNVAQPSKAQLALWCEVSPTSGGYYNNLGTLRSSGLIDYPTPGHVCLTEAGMERAAFPDPMTQEEMHEALYRKLGEAKAKVLRRLIAVWPEEVRKVDLAETIGVSPTSGGYFNNLGTLRTLGLIDYPTSGYARATDILFLEQK